LKECDEMTKYDIASASYDELVQFVREIGEKPFRSRQIFGWIHRNHATEFSEMTNLSADSRIKLMQHAELNKITMITSEISADLTTKKYLFKLQENGMIDSEGSFVEAVLMTHRHGLSLCVSSQAGCKMGCDFCASGIGGFHRNLTAGEIAAQYYAACRDADKRIGNIVIMGCGEPLDNYDNVLKFINIVCDDRGVGFGQRNIALSTCGIVPRVYDLMKENLQITLAISLHAPNDQIRRKLMPIARKYSIDELLTAGKAYSTIRRVSFEYALFSGVNDSVANARELTKRLAGINCHVNLIPGNRIPEKGYTKSGRKAIADFAEVLTASGFQVTIRREFGSDISAACGQLRNKYKCTHTVK